MIERDAPLVRRIASVIKPEVAMAATPEQATNYAINAALQVLDVHELQAVAKLLRALPLVRDGWELGLAMEALPQSIIDWAQVLDADGDRFISRTD